MAGSIYNKRFVIVAGKGGVGKSTVCAALALATARQGKNVLIAELANTEIAPYLFDGDRPSGYRCAEIYPGISSINITPGPALEEYGLMKLRWRRLYQTVFENDAMRSLLRMLPGMNELLLLGKAWHLEQERNPRTGRPRWDMIIVDSPATGHGISIFQLPQVIIETIKSGPMLDETRQIRNLLLDRDRTCLNLVTLLEEMPVNETLELQQANLSSLHIEPGFLFLNAVWPDVPPISELDILRAYRNVATGRDPRFDNVMSVMRFMVRRRKTQNVHLSRLQSRCTLRSVELPYIFMDSFGFNAIDALSLKLAAEIDRHEHGAA